MRNIISVDVEEYFHAANLAPVAGPGRWRSLPSRVDWATREVLDLFDRHSTKATFFVLGYSARRYPQLVKDIVAAGHEVASHGYGHRIAYQQSPQQFLRDVRIAKQLLEDISGVEVLGYRAPNFSITPKNPWAYSSLVEAGYRYDSSRFPVWHPRYANQQASLLPETLDIEGSPLTVFPLAVATLDVFSKTYRLPVAGGAYWRLLPCWYSAWGLRQCNRAQRIGVTYFHPWELDPGQPVFSELPLRTRIRHYGNASTFKERVAYFLKRFEFSSFAEAAKDLIPGPERRRE
jgi:polysaccharide deacetylase family protein (PEP-CTERM system associated)